MYLGIKFLNCLLHIVEPLSNRQMPTVTSNKLVTVGLLNYIFSFHRPPFSYYFSTTHAAIKIYHSRVYIHFLISY